MPARYYARLYQILQNRNIPTGPLLDAAGITLADLNKPEAVISMLQVEALVEAAMQATESKDLALDLARALKLTSHSSVSYGILSSPTGGYALHLVARFFSLILPAFRVAYATDSRYMRVTVTPVWAMSHKCLAFHLELIAACVHWELRDLIGGSLPPYHIYFSLDEPPHVHRYEQLSGAQVHFGWQTRPGFIMQWPVEVATRPVSLADPAALELAEKRCNEIVNKARVTGDISAWASMMLNEARGGPPSIEELAQALNLSSRTLDRYLKKEGTSFRSLSKQARYAKACSMLDRNRLSVTQIALELGYTDASNFARAFKRESSVSPSVWRENRQKEKSSG